MLSCCHAVMSDASQQWGSTVVATVLISTNSTPCSSFQSTQQYNVPGRRFWKRNTKTLWRCVGNSNAHAPTTTVAWNEIDQWQNRNCSRLANPRGHCSKVENSKVENSSKVENCSISLNVIWIGQKYWSTDRKERTIVHAPDANSDLRFLNHSHIVGTVPDG